MSPPITQEDTPTMTLKERKIGLQENKKTNDNEAEADLYLGEWERSLAWRDDDFARDNMATHPHLPRRKEILKAHPQIRKLYGHDDHTLLIILFGIGVHCLVGWMLRDGSTSTSGSIIYWFINISLAAVLGGSIADLMAICVHECCHSSVSPNSFINKLAALLCNVGTPVPIAMSFRRYHSDHHAFQGSELKDPDMPLPWELTLIRGTFWPKLAWLALYPIMYAVRAMVRGRNVTFWEAINVIFTIATDILLFKLCGWRGIIYFTLSFVIGYTFHPVAAHFIQEHYTFVDGQETYNYYGWSNTIFLNIGFHNEHHDFPNIPARHLPLVTKMAPEYYVPLASHKSWRQVLKSFLLDTNMGPVSRCART